MKNCKLFKMSHKYRIFLMVLLMFLCGRTYAQENEGDGQTPQKETAKYLWVWQKDGGTVSFPISERPRITVDFAGSEVKCVSKTEEVTFDLKSVLKYTLNAYENEAASVEENIKEEGSFKKNADNLFFNNFKEGTPVTIYNINGVVLGTYKADAAGSLNIPTTGWGNGIYLVKVGSLTYKITIK